MCGIVGWIGGNPDIGLARSMLASLAHRGPDDGGEWCDMSTPVWLGHRRLSIIDLSPEGRQPMSSQGGRYTITYNGEVFNYDHLREELLGLGFAFRGRSDTEVILAAIEAWGVENATKKFIGMFAFGLYDRAESCMWLVRDRLGIKPLYYAERDGELVFGSELRPLRRLPWLDREIDPDALHAYFRYLCVPAPATIVRGARKLMPGAMLRWSAKGSRIIRYWDLKEVAEAGIRNPLTCSFGEAADELEHRLKDAVRLRMLSDVPLGAFLSGGVDSSTVAAIMQASSSVPVKTFSIGFKEFSHDESRHAMAVANHLGTEHREYPVTPEDLLVVIPKLPDIQDEPFADNSIVPTYLVSLFARRHVTVAISGDGGDELFGGYPRYFWADRIERARHALTRTGASWAGRVLRAIPPSLWDGLLSMFGGGRYAGSEGLSARVRRLAGYLMCSPESVYENMISAWKDPCELTGRRPHQLLGPDMGRFSGMKWSEKMMATDQTNYLVDDILTKVDRASMAVSLEARVPLLDHRLVEWSWRIPLAYKLSPGGDRGKLVLREVLSRYVPGELIERPKMGFGMPLGKWLRSGLRAWAEDLLSSDALGKGGLLDPSAVRKVWREHLSGDDRTQQIWTVLMFQQWRQ